jgi:hypothetical protein
MVGSYKKIHKIKIKDSENRNTWYFSRRGEVFDTELVKVGEKEFYQIDSLHKVPSQYAKVLEVRKEAKYFK